MTTKTEQLKKDIAWLIRDKYAGDSTAAGISQDILRLKAGEPLDYVIGWKEFLGCKIDLSKKPLIPREETEHWVEEVMKSKIRLGKSKVLDLFAGSGCIGVAILKHFPNTHVTFGEKDTKMIEQIKINLKLSKISPTRYKVYQSDVFSQINSRYDYIFANPPYIAKKLAQKTQKSVIKWEPAEALWGGPDGLSFIKKFLKAVSIFLKNDGKIFMEFDHQQQESIKNLLKQLSYKNYTFHRDQFGRSRWVEIEK
ncbi:MAG: peptide chain release factor N(5)-glutamine methyltransferase [bacterium]